MTISIDCYGSRAAASMAAAASLSKALRRALSERSNATLVVSGGSTPKACFQYLAQEDLPWSRVRVTVTDERCVPALHEDSNQRMVREHLLVDRAATANFTDLTEVGNEPFAAVLAGMGSDGHFASLFPDAVNLAEALALDNPRPTLKVHTSASPHPRISMSLARLINTQQLLLLAFGDDKRAILDDPAGYPVAALLRQQTTRQQTTKQQTSMRSPLRVLWAQ